VTLVLSPEMAAVLLPDTMIAAVGAFHVQYASRQTDIDMGSATVLILPGLMFCVYPHCLVSYCYYVNFSRFFR
jgi:hypothetical protein